MSSSPRTTELDGLRAGAVWIVMLFHAGAPLTAWGWLGVDVFFVLSGFLITTLLLKEHERTGGINILAFLYRRALRLLPAYILYIAGVTIFFVAIGGRIIPQFADTLSEVTYIGSLWTYTANYLPPGKPWEYHHLITHLWSLAVEQQFYIVLPLVLVAVPSLPGMTWRILLLGAVFVAGTALEVFPGRPNFTLTGRGISLIVGCLAASLAYSYRHTFEHRRRMFRALHIAALAGSVLMTGVIVYQVQVLGMHQAHILAITSPIFWSVLAVVVAGYWYGWSRLLSGFLSSAPLAYTGAISYGMYLYHKFAWEIAFGQTPPYGLTGLGRYADYGTKLFIYFAITYILAAISYRWLEQPFLRMKSSIGRRHKAVES